ALVSASPDPTMLTAANSILGPGTLNQGVFGGGRFTVGFSLDCAPNLGFEASYFFLGRRSRDFLAGGSGLPGDINFGRPIFAIGGTGPNANTAVPDAQLVAR